LATAETDRTDTFDPSETSPSEPVPARPRWRTVLSWMITAAAAILVFSSLAAPDRLSRLTPVVFLRIPIEALLAVALFIVLPPRWRRVAALVLGALLGLTTIAKVFNMGFYASLSRAFDPTSDWGFLPPAVDYLERNVGHTDAVLAVIGAIVLGIAVLVLCALSVVRLSTIAAHHRTVAARTVGALGVVWVLLAVVGVRFIPSEPVASYSAAGVAYRELHQVALGIEDQKIFAERFANDPFAATPGNELLTGLRGKNVLLTFVESYGRVAIQDPGIAPRVTAVLDAGTASLRAAGYSARSAFLTSSTSGGGSWLAHSTLQSGLWINSEQRYGQFTASNRFTLSVAFKRAGWQTTGLLPANRYDWPEGALYGYDKIIDSRNMGYQGKTYSFQSIPDQYTLSALQQIEFKTVRQHPLFAEVDLVSSHAPWEPVPPLVDWGTIGDGAQFTGAAGAFDPTDTVFQQAVSQVHADYAQTIEYSLRSLIQYIERYGDDNLVLVFLGDHQPAPIVSGEDASRDVPITIVAKDPAVLSQVSGWGWQDGLRPDPTAPVWRMDEFRDRFLTAFGSQTAR
jgi:hypothetical protein